jgi:hypothetical protein
MMSQPCSAVELVLFDARELANPTIRANVESVVSLGVLAGAILDDEQVAKVVDAAGQADRLGFWFGSDGEWPFDRAMAFANVEPGRTLFVSGDDTARHEAEAHGLRTFDDRTSDIVALLP